MLANIAEYLSKEWSAISQAPVSFIIALLLLVTLMWAIARHLTSVQLANRDSMINLKNAIIEDYKRKLDGASPDEAQRRIQALESKLESMGDPRVLTRDQLDQIGRALGGQVGEIYITRDNDSVESSGIFTQVKRFFKSQGWQVNGGAIWGIENPPNSGLTVFVRTGDFRSADEIALLAGLDAAKLNYDIRREEEAENQPRLQLNFSDQE